MAWKKDSVGLYKVLILCCITLSIYCITRSVASQSSKDLLLGVSPQDESYYKGLSSSNPIKCKDGSKKFNKSQFNDDFCDCPDGSDEPGTSACPNGKFFCKNAGHVPVVVYSSRVNDGICDCCDGSDEYNGKTKCPNTCWEAGKVAREKLNKKIATYREGISIRKKEIEQANLAIAKEEEELSKLKSEEEILKPLVEKLKEHKEQIEKAEEEERRQKEKEEKEKKEKEGKTEDTEHAQNDNHDDNEKADEHQQDFEEVDHKSADEPEIIDNFIEEGLQNDEVEGLKEGSHEDSVHTAEVPTSDDNPKLDAEKQDSEHMGEVLTSNDKPGPDAEKQDENTAESTESLSREELGRLVASRWTGDKTKQHEESDASINKDDHIPDETPNETTDDEDNSYVSEADEHKDDDDDESYDDPLDDLDQEERYDSSPSHSPMSDDESESTDLTTTSCSSWLGKIQKTVKNIFQAVNLFQKPVNISDAARVRIEYDESNEKLSKIQSRISSLTKKLKHDFGPEKEFYSFHGQCFESKQNKYVYKVCPFKKATQEEGYSNTRLGSWDKFENSYRIMQFMNGDKCWNGPDRSLKVKLRCGLKNELTEVDEPSRCEYLALLSTPALCLDSKLKELENKLEALNKEGHSGHEHDEL